MGSSSGNGPISRFRPGNNIDHYVRREIEKTAIASAENRLNAIAADGLPVVYYQKTSTGALCTCQSRNSDTLSEEIFPIEDDGEPQTIEQMIKPAPAFGRYQQLKETESQELSDSQLDRAVAAGVSRLTFDQGDGVACGICFRTGYEAGYQLASGLRTILTGRNTSYLGPMVDLQPNHLPSQLLCHRHKALQTQSSPSVNPIPANSSFVRWNQVEVPIVWDSLRVGVFHNDSPVYDSWIVLRSGSGLNTQYWPLLNGNLISTAGQTLSPDISEVEIFVSASRPFTHCLIEFETLADRPAVSFPQLSISKLLEDFEGIGSLNLEISGQSIGMVKPGDLLFVPRLKKVLTVSGPVNRLLTPSLQRPVGWSTEARVIQPVELQTVLQELVDSTSAPFPI